jgi:hypothetical protein
MLSYAEALKLAKEGHMMIGGEDGCPGWTILCPCGEYYPVDVEIGKNGTTLGTEIICTCPHCGHSQKTKVDDGE